MTIPPPQPLPLMKLHKIKVQPFEVTLHVGFVKDPSKALIEIEGRYKWMTKNSTYEKNIAGLHLYHPDYSNKALILLKPSSDIRTVVHEAFHCVVAICETHGVPLTTDNDETGAYMIDYIVGRILRLQKKVNEEETVRIVEDVLGIRGKEEGGYTVQ